MMLEINYISCQSVILDVFIMIKFSGIDAL